MDSSHQPIRLWYRLTGALGDDAIAGDAVLLSSDEAARSRRFAFADDRRDFIAAHGLLRRALSELRPITAKAWRFERRPGGKPAVAAHQQSEPPLAFNLSHTRGLVACVVSFAREVGIDVEREDRSVDVDAVAARFFHPAETAWLQALPEPARRTRFLDLWTLKEAFLKATGAGLRTPLHECLFEISDEGRITLTCDATMEPAWNFAAYRVCGGRYRIAIAYEGRAVEPPRLEAFPP